MAFLLPSLLLLMMSAPQGAGVTYPESADQVEARVQPIGKGSLAALLSERNGKPLLMNVWATWCAPCVEEFPDLERLHRTYGPEGLDVVVVSIDYEDEVTSKVIPFLRKMDATMPAYINAFPKPTELIEALDPDWSGAVPATFMFDQKGNRVRSVIGKQSYKEFEALVLPFLADRSSGKRVR